MVDGYELMENIIPKDDVEYLQEYTLLVKRRVTPKIGLTRSVGDGTYWRGVDMASEFSMSSSEENKKLYDFYTSNFMYNIIRDYIKEPYLFNNQIVVKLPNERFWFKPHFDNQYGPNPNDKELVTINCMLILDDFTEQNGAISLKSQLSNTWRTLYPKTGDMLLIDGNTVHASKMNKTDLVRRAYICVYANKPIGKDFKEGYYYEKWL
jgi:hypothetical protein